MARLLLLSVAVRFVFYKFFFSENWNIHMLQKFDDRALAVAKGQMVENFAAWGTYPLFLGAFYKFLDVLSLIAYRVEIMFWVNQILSLVVVFLWYQTAKNYKLNLKITVWILAILALFNPYFIYLSGMNMSELPYVLIISIFFYWHSRSLGSVYSQSWWVFLILGCALANAYSLRNIIILFAYALPFILLFPRSLRDFFKNIHLIGFYFVGFFMTVTLLGFGNAKYDTHQRELLSTNRGANLAQNWCEVKILETKSEKGEFWYSPPDYWSLSLRRSLFFSVPFDETVFYFQSAIRCLSEEPLRIVTHFRSWVSVFDGPLYPDPAGFNQKRIIFWIAGFPLLVLFLFSFSLLLKERRYSLHWFYLGSCLVAIYVGNPGEMRFLYSLYGPLLLVSIAALERGVERSDNLKKWIFGAFVSAVALINIPKISEFVVKREREQIFGLEVSKLPTVMQKDIQSFQAVMPICPEEKTLFDRCIENTELCSQEKLIDSYLEDKKARAISEMELLCRNYFLVQLRNRAGFSFEVAQIQKPSALPTEGAHPIEAIAAQLFHVDLLIGIGKHEFINSGESYRELLHELRQFQYMPKPSTAAPQGQVRQYAQKREVSSEAEAIYFWTLNEAIKSIYHFERSSIPLDHLKK